ncbi:hypothetical protein [Nocardioides jishulii]|uniref:WD40 repeat domain-containing protein n=1 Tax=Nocardioides jishulii TaxID=2575440 RepID=A0A4U2YUJ3_9ACTN|nr:hypothetical protein [Nocardioides jishulii]QCX28363.1 hypothetical protein FCL41_13165 [Nocardioides jishulii]TKI64744.1 hypothetical protein FC770_06410 [Nocardioides jishulii]
MNDDLTGQRVGSALRDHVPSTPQAPFGLDDVKGRADSIRRRRRAGGAALAAFALMATGPVVVTTLTGAPEDLPATTSPSLAPALTLPNKVVLATDAPLDEGTEGDWLIGDGELSGAFPFPAGAQDGLTRVGERWLVEYAVDGERKVYSIDLADGSGRSVDIPTAVAEATTHDLHDVVAVSDDSTLAVFSTPSGELTLIGADGRTRVVATLPSPATPVDLVGDGACLDGGDCEVVVSYGDGSAPELVAGDGTRTVIDADAVAVTAANDDLVVTRDAEASPGEDPCSTVRDRSTLQEVWRSCEVGVESFSPDGTHAVVVDAYQSGSGATRMGLADARTGTQVTWFLPDDDQGIVKDLAWTPQGDIELTSFTYGDQTWHLHHVTVDGTVSRLVEGRRGEDVEPAFILATRP